jgi:hypothetical protein
MEVEWDVAEFDQHKFIFPDYYFIEYHFFNVFSIFTGPKQLSLVILFLFFPSYSIRWASNPFAQ